MLKDFEPSELKFQKGKNYQSGKGKIYLFQEEKITQSKLALSQRAKKRGLEILKKRHEPCSRSFRQLMGFGQVFSSFVDRLRFIF